jgi:hypothetical protein
MICSISILVFSTALFIFYVQTLCEKVLRREFRRAYFQDVVNSIEMEFPRLRRALSAGAPMSYSQIQLALKSDYSMLTYLVKNGDSRQPGFSWQERLLMGYFRLLLLILPVRYAFHFREKQAAMKLTVILRHFANLVGERVFAHEAHGVAASLQA